MSFRHCPICEKTSQNNKIFLKKNIKEGEITSFSFSSRKLPEFMNHKLTLCSLCSLVYVDNPPQEVELANSYHQADYDSGKEADMAADTYMYYMEEAIGRLDVTGKALDIGTGNGILLELLNARGFSIVKGVEPSKEAINSAPEKRKSWIIEGIFNESDFSENSFDLICCFMTMEHVKDPKILSRSVLNLLKPGGIFVTVAHDYQSIINKILGKNSPIIDIEHMQIFSKKSMTDLLTSCGYVDVGIKSISNRYPITYWTRLLPLPNIFKTLILRMIKLLGMSNLNIGINVGNMMSIARKKNEKL